MCLRCVLADLREYDEKCFSQAIKLLLKNLQVAAKTKEETICQQIKIGKGGFGELWRIDLVKKMIRTVGYVENPSADLVEVTQIDNDKYEGDTYRLVCCKEIVEAYLQNVLKNLSGR